MRRTAIVAAALVRCDGREQRSWSDAAEPPTATPIAVSYDDAASGSRSRALRRGRHPGRARVAGRHERAAGRRARRRRRGPRRRAASRSPTSSAVTAAHRRWPSTASPKFIVATPGPVVYGLQSTARRGPRVRRHFAGRRQRRPGRRPPSHRRSVAVPRTALGAFGNTADGVVDRIRQTGAVMIGHVDVNGAPVGTVRRTAVADRRRQRRDRRFPAVVAGNPAAPRLATAVRRRVAAGADRQQRRRVLDLRRPADRG